MVIKLLEINLRLFHKFKLFELLLKYSISKLYNKYKIQ